ncbi:MAG: threonine--tRNA ligase [Clostridiales bacterium GWF2_36_10]|nr:MAG: threonine--tRNA ligase [Clostridiales bacterium GWF2_36_10]HAN21467.1 threonine--tRNA ligase [Clostridiales bacterium]
MENADFNELHALRHTASHILAQAVKRLYPSAKLAIGPAIENGFYYDIDCEVSFTPEVLELLEKEMKKITGENLKVERFVLSRTEALDLMKNEPYKVELINDLPEDAEISFYKQGEFTDLCAGPHVSYTKKIKAFKLTQATGAYWRGDSKNKMLQRIYGTAFKTQEELDKYLADVEEAKKRDHNKLGRQLGYFTTVDIIGQGLPIILPKGTIVMRTLQRFVEDEEERRGYLQTKTPLFAKRELFKISGHWDHYRDGMFIMGDTADQDKPEAEIFALRPMTCPFQFQAYLTQMRSYKELPLRYNETSTLFRNESSGEMHGLIRVRQFTISEGHLACTPEQLETEFAGCLELAQFMLGTLGLDEDVSYRFSKWDEKDKQKYIGDAAQWEAVQGTMRGILNDINIDYYEADGEAAFYGPKLDIQIKNVHGKEDTLITIQIDFQLAERFGMEYVDKDGLKKFPFVIHRTSIGCYERTLALLIEKYAGAMPTWLAPEQVRIISITDSQKGYAESVQKRFKNLGIRVGLDNRSEKLGYKIREAQLEKMPYMLVIGEKEKENGTLGVRSRKNGDMGEMSVDAFEAIILKEIATKEN